MESTGVYWVPAFEILESAGIDVIVANAREPRSVPARKSDINDAHGGNTCMPAGVLLRASFRPGLDIAECGEINAGATATQNPKSHLTGRLRQLWRTDGTLVCSLKKLK